jgi:PIN domain nuclease of toxin-antitoxin system
VILLDTHVWVWWVHGEAKLPEQLHTYIDANQASGLGISIISCWEIAKLVEYQRLILPQPVEAWMSQALAYPGIQLLSLTPRIVVESTQLPGAFHRDPADQLLVATARVHNYPLVTLDEKILAYPDVQHPDIGITKV